MAHCIPVKFLNSNVTPQQSRHDRQSNFLSLIVLGRCHFLWLKNLDSALLPHCGNSMIHLGNLLSSNFCHMLTVDNQDGIPNQICKVQTSFLQVGYNEAESS